MTRLNELKNDTDVGKLHLEMSKEQLAAQPDAGQSDYVEIEQVEIEQDMNAELDQRPDSESQEGR